MEYILSLQSSPAGQNEESDLSFSPLVDVPRMEEEDSKVLFFDELLALGQSSDDEEDTNELKSLRFPKKIPPPFPSSSFLSYSPSHSPTEIVPNQKRILPNPAKMIPTIHRTNSAPVQSTRTIAETPALALSRKTSLLRHDISADVTPNTSFNFESPRQGPTPSEKPQLERRTISTPTFGSVIMTNSTGIMNMLNNNSKKRKDITKEPSKETKKELKKRKSGSMAKISEDEQYLRGHTFCYIPANDKNQGRKRRILRVQDYGGIWARAWNPSVSFVVVDDLEKTFDQALSDLKDTCPGVDIPLSVIFVNSNYPLECISRKKILNHDQLKYKVKGSERESTQDLLLQDLSDHSAEPSPKRQRSREESPSEPSLAHQTSQAYSPIFEFPESQIHIGSKPYLVETPRETTPEDVQYKSFGDELDELIKESKSTAHLPLDLDDDDNDEERPSSSESYGEYNSDDYGSEGEREHKAATARKLLVKQKKQRKGEKGDKNDSAPPQPFDQSNFSCMVGGSGDSIEGNPNRRTIEILLEMAAVYNRLKFLNDNWRELAYKRAAGILKKQTQKICTFEEAIALPYIGNRLATKIEEIARTNRLQRLEYALAEPDDYLLQLFSGVYNVGPSRAHDWVRAGYKSLEEVVQKVKLTKSQEIGIAHYDDFKTRIPREEVTTLGKIVTDAAAEIDPSIEIIISGSYRRGVASSGDIDCMVTRAGTNSTSQLKRFLYKLVGKLTDSEFLVAALAVPNNETDDGSKWHGACVLPSSDQKIWRRIDFLLVPTTEFGAALIYFTGDDIFNRSLRLLASKKGMRLNQRGLYKDVMRGKNRVKITEGSLVEGADEVRIFEILGVPWREPHDRICH